MSLYNLSKDMLIKLIATCQEEKDKEIKIIKEKLEIKAQQCNILEKLTDFSIVTCFKCDGYEIVQYDEFENGNICDKCEKYICFECGFYCEHIDKNGEECLCYNCFSCNDNEKFYCIEHIELH